MTTRFTDKTALLFGAVELVLTFMDDGPRNYALTLTATPEEHQQIRHKWLLAFAEEWKLNIELSTEEEFVEETVNHLFAGEQEEFKDFVSTNKTYFEDLHSARKASVPKTESKSWWWLW